MYYTVMSAALEFLDRKREKFKYIYKGIRPDKYRIEETEHDMEHNKITFYDDIGNNLLESRYEILGLYSSEHKLWCWAWSIPTLNKNQINISKQILSYGLDIQAKNLTQAKSELITSRFKINHRIQLEMRIALATYLSKKGVYKYRLKKGKEDSYIDIYIFLLDMDSNVIPKTTTTNELQLQYDIV